MLVQQLHRIVNGSAAMLANKGLVAVAQADESEGFCCMYTSDKAHKSWDAHSDFET